MLEDMEIVTSSWKKKESNLKKLLQIKYILLENPTRWYCRSFRLSMEVLQKILLWILLPCCSKPLPGKTTGRWLISVSLNNTCPSERKKKQYSCLVAMSGVYSEFFDRYPGQHFTSNSVAGFRTFLLATQTLHEPLIGRTVHQIQSTIQHVLVLRL